MLGAFAGCRSETPPAGASQPRQEASRSDFAGELRSEKGAESETAGSPVNIAVVRFEDKGTSIEFNRLGAVMAEMLAHDLGQYPQLQILERTASGELILERHLAETGLAEGGTDKVEKLVAEYLVAGSCDASAGKLVVTASLTKVGSAQAQGIWEYTGAIDDFLGFETAVVKKLSEALKLSPATRRKLPAAPSESSPTLAILTLKNQGPSASMDVMQAGFADILQASVGAMAEVRMVDRTQIENILTEQKLSLSGLIDPETAVQVGQLLRAERLLVGSFVELGPNLGIQTRLIDAQTGSIVASQRVSGPKKQFGQLMEELTLDIVNDLSLPPTDRVGAVGKAILPARSLESAIHFATATRRMSEGRHLQAAEAYQQVLLLEPENILCYVRQSAAYWQLRRLADVERTANQALARKEFAEAPLGQRLEILWMLAYGYSELKRYPELVQVTDRILAAIPDAIHNVNSLRGSTLIRLNRYEEGIKLMESAAAGDPDPATDWKNLALQDLFLFFAFDIKDWRAPESARTTAKTREACRRAMEIFDRILISAAGKRDRDARKWAELFVPVLAEHLIYVDEQGYNQLYLSPAERADAMRRALEVFDWDPVTAAQGKFSLGVSSEEAQLWSQALSGYRGFLETCPKLEQVEGVHQGQIPSIYNNTALQPKTWIDQRIEAYYRLARIEQDGLKQPEKAAQAYQTMVRAVGLSNFRGPDAVVSMAKLDIQPEYPDRCALVWGWESNGQRSWNRVLGPAGYQVHSLRTPLVTPAQLAPYSLIVLARSGSMIFTPTEILALRSYVAAGGSLLAVVTPGWEPAAPAIHNGLLKFFDMEVGAALPPKVSGTRILPHPITSGISRSQATAKCGVALRAPPESVLIAAGDDGLLAATEYRFGRVVVAAFGQWLLPEPSIFPGGWQHHRIGHWTTQVSPADLPFETGENLCRPLLENVIRWLGERRERSPDFSKWKTELTAAHWTAWRVHARSLDWSTMAASHARLIAAAFDATTREESLWTAGEAYFNPRAFSEGRPLIQPTYGHEPGVPHDPEPAHYQQLIELFPDSPLFNYAQWRLADCERLRSDRGGNRQAISAFGKVSAPPASYPWAWARLRQGALEIRMADLSTASASLKEVVESMPRGPERTIALAMAGDCLIKTGQSAEARRLFEELDSLPEMSWDRLADGSLEWYPITSFHNSSRQLSFEALRKLGKP
jgi:TolB-like protein/tetratricopeptide (TPR) repeat protein